MCSCDQSLVTLAFLRETLLQPQFCKDLTRKTAFFEGWSSFKFNNLGLALGTNLKFYTSVAKGLKLKVRKFWGLTRTFVKVTGKKLVEEGDFLPLFRRHTINPETLENGITECRRNNRIPRKSGRTTGVIRN